MIHRMAVKTSEIMVEHSIIEAKATHIYAYGLELLFSSLVGGVALIIISTACGTPFLWIPYLTGFVPLRLSEGGYHAKTHFRCIFTFTLLYSLVLLIEILFVIPVRAWLIACFVNLAITLFFSPVAAPNKPLKEGQGRTNRRNSLFLATGNLVACAVLVFLSIPKSKWVEMYFAGGSVAGLSTLLAVINNHGRRISL